MCQPRWPHDATRPHDLFDLAAAEKARAAQKASEDAVHAAKAREMSAVAAGEKATLRAVKAREAVWKLVDEDRRKRGLSGLGGAGGGWDENGAPRGYGEIRETHLGCTLAATDLCRRVHEIQQRRKRVVSLGGLGFVLR